MKKYIKPSIIVEEAQLFAVMDSASVTGETKDGDKIVVSAKESGFLWDDSADDDE